MSESVTILVTKLPSQGEFYLLTGVPDADVAEMRKKLKSGKVVEVMERLEELVKQGRAVRG